MTTMRSSVEEEGVEEQSQGFNPTLLGLLAIGVIFIVGIILLFSVLFSQDCPPCSSPSPSPSPVPFPTSSPSPFPTFTLLPSPTPTSPPPVPTPFSTPTPTPLPSPPPSPSPEPEVVDNFFVRRFGAEDEDGAVNYITNDVVLSSLQYVKQGKVYHLSETTAPETPALSPRTYKAYLQVMGNGQGQTLNENDRWNEDVAFHSIGVGTHLDSFAHWTRDWKTYNAVPQADIMNLETGTPKKMGSGNLKPMVTRGVLLDFVKLMCAGEVGGGDLACVDDHLPPSTPIYKEDIERAITFFGVSPIKEGDVVLFHTGYGNILRSPTPENYIVNPPGLEEGSCEWLGSIGAVALGADTFSFDVVPPVAGQLTFGCHPILLNRYGTHILEYIRTDELAADGVKDFMFVLGVPKLMGLVQANIAPLAIV
uniref:Cyclase family protein n=1 Tax=Paramoeba aestuarina TaxID=180227 RepID=A0A7S4PB11_9EUKA|mmetsp:Transcript_39255/g.62120  ORF Transcript_39255/g.62120 Transcript_39255/m.62120 type:complete len:422 (+) Transcript_39255:57-1322(+)